MMRQLFKPHRPRNVDNHYRPPRKRQQDRPLPRFMSQLELFCYKTEAHPLPVTMIFIGECISDNGQRMAVFACSHDKCQWREGWVRDRDNPRQAYRLFGRFYYR
jgi:hypothetical protein